MQTRTSLVPFASRFFVLPLLAAFVAAVGLIGAMAVPAQALVVIYDTFTATDGTSSQGWTPDVTDLPGGTWAVGGYYSTQIQDNAIYLGPDQGATITLASSGTYVKPSVMTISADLKLGTCTTYGMGLGYNSTAMNTSGGSDWNTFTGLQLKGNGSLVFNHNNSLSTAVAWSGAAFDPNAYYNLTYTIDTTTGALSGIQLQGSSADYSSLITAAGTTNFTTANTAFGNIIAQGGGGGDRGWIDNFLLDGGVTLVWNAGADGDWSDSTWTTPGTPLFPDSTVEAKIDTPWTVTVDGARTAAGLTISDGGALDVAASNSLTVSGRTTVEAGSSITVQDTGVFSSDSGTIALLNTNGGTATIGATSAADTLTVTDLDVQSVAGTTLVKTGTGVLGVGTLSNATANTGVTVQGGTFQTSGATPLGAAGGTIALDDGTFAVDHTAEVTVANPITMTTNGGGLAATNAKVNYGAITIPNGATLSTSGAGQTTVASTTLAGATATISSSNRHSVGTYTDGASAKTITIAGVTGGATIFDNTTPGNIVAGATAFQVNSGTLEGMGASPLGGATSVTLNGGTLTLSVGGTTPYTPLNATPQAWYDASTLALSDGDPVTAWSDSSANGRDLVTYQNTPNFKANVINGLPAVNFRSESLQLASSDPYFAKDVYLVFRSDSGTTFRGWGAPIGVKDGPDGDRMWMLGQNDDRFWADELPSAVSRNGEVVLSSNNFELGADCGQYMVLKVTAGPNSGTQVRDMIVGSRTDAWNDGYFDTAEVLAFNYALSTEEENDLGGYLASKYGIATSYTGGGPTPDVSGDLVMTSTNLTVEANSTLNAVTDGSASFGALNITGGELTAKGSPDGISFTGTSVAATKTGGVNAEVPVTLGSALTLGNAATFSAAGTVSNTSTVLSGASGTINTGDTFNIGTYDDGTATKTLTLGGTGTKVMDNSAGGIVAAHTTLRLEGGTLDTTPTAVGTNDPLGGSTAIQLAGGTLKLKGSEDVTLLASKTWDFESGDMTGWNVVPYSKSGTGDIFSDGHQPVSAEAHNGLYGVNTFRQENPSGASDSYTGITETDTFVIDSAGTVSFKIASAAANAFSGDPDDPNTNMTCFTLERQVAPGDWEMLENKKHGSNWDLEDVSWNTTAYVGDTVRLRIYDTSTGGWGHIAIDDIVATNIAAVGVLPISMMDKDFSVDATSTIQAVSDVSASFGGLTLNNGTLTLTGSPVMSFTGTSIAAAATEVGVSFDDNVAATLGAITGTSTPTATFIKAGTGALTLNASNTGLGNVTFDVQAGSLIAPAPASLGGSTAMQLSSGSLLLSSTGGPAAYDIATTVTENSTLTAGKAAGGADGPLTVTLGSAGKLLTVQNSKTLTVGVTDSYVLDINNSVTLEDNAQMDFNVADGKINNIGAASLSMGSGSTLNLDAGTLTTDKALDVYNLNLNGGGLVQTTPQNLNVRGILKVDNAAVNLDLTGGALLTTTPSATINLVNGTITTDQPLDVGNLTVEAGGTLNRTGGTPALKDVSVGGKLRLVNKSFATTGSTLAVGDRIELDNSTLTYDNAMSFNSLYAINNSQILPGAGMTVNNELRLDSGSSADFSGQTLSMGSLYMNAGTLTYDNAQSVSSLDMYNNSVINTGADMAISGRLRLESGSEADFSGLTMSMGSLYMNSGTLTYDSAQTISRLEMYGTSTLNPGAATIINGQIDMHNDSSADFSATTLTVPGWSNLIMHQNAALKVAAGTTLNINYWEGSDGATLDAAGSTVVLKDRAQLQRGTYNMNIQGETDSTSRWMRIGGGGDAIFTGTNTYKGRTEIHEGTVLVATDGVGLPADSRIYFNNGIWGSSGTINRTIGSSDGNNVYWQNWGGFAAYGGDLTVSLTPTGGAAGDPLTWNNSTTGFRSQGLYLGSTNATHDVELTNNILINATANINTPSKTKLATLSGDLTGSSQLNKQGYGTLALTGDTSAFTGEMRISRGALDVGLNGVGMGTGLTRLYADSSNQNDKGAILQANGTLAKDVGNAAGKIYWDNNGGGFAARGGTLAVTLNSGATILWGAEDGFRSKRLMFGSGTADDVVTLTNDIDGQTGYREIYAFDNPNSANDKAVLSGAVTNMRGFSKRGDGLLEMSNSLITANGDQTRQYGGGTMKINGDFQVGNLYTGTDPRYIGSANGNNIEIYENSALQVTGNIQANYLYMNNSASNSIDVGGDVSLYNRWNMENGTAHIGGNLQTGNDHSYFDRGTVTIDGNLRSGLAYAGGGADRNVYVRNGGDLTVNGDLDAGWLETSGSDGTRASSVHLNGIATIGNNGNGNMKFNAENQPDGGVLDGSGTVKANYVEFHNGAKLGGTLTLNVSNKVEMHGSNSILAPGNSAGTLNIVGNLQMNGGSHYEFEGGDLTNVTGTLTVNDNWTLDLMAGGYRLAEGGSITLFNYGALGTFDIAPTYNVASLIAAGWLAPSYDTSSWTISTGGSEIVLNGLQLSAPEWTGLGGDNKWQTGANWDLPIGSGSLLKFDGSTQTTTDNDFVAGTPFAGITFNAGADEFTLAGNSIGMAGNIDNLSANAQNINVPMVIGASTTVNTGSQNMTLGGDISGTGGVLTKNGSGMLTINGTNTYTGGTQVNEGTVKLGSAASLPDAALTIAGGTLDLNTFTATITAPISFQSGTTANGTVINNGSAYDGQAGAVSASLQGTAGLTKTTGGELILTGSSNTYAGATTINAGTLRADGSLANSAITVNSGGHLATGADSATVGSLTAKSLTLSTDAIVDFKFDTTFDNFIITDVDGLVLADGRLGLYTTAGANFSDVGTYRLFQYDGTSSDVDTTDTRVLNRVSGRTYAFSTVLDVSKFLELDISAMVPDTITWDGDTDDQWSTAGNWVTTPPTYGATIVFADIAGGTSNNDIPTGVDTLYSNLIFDATAGAQTVTGNSITLMGIGGNLIINSSAVAQTVDLPLTLGGDGDIDAANGAIVMGSSATIATAGYTPNFTGANDISVAGVISGNGGLAKSGAGTLTLTGSNSYSGNTAINGGTLLLAGASTLGTAGVYAGDIAIAAGATLNHSSSVTSLELSGDISGDGGLTYHGHIVSPDYQGSTTLTLSGTNTYTGATIVDGPMSQHWTKLMAGSTQAFGLPTTADLQFTAASGGQRRNVIDLRGYSQTVIGLTAANVNDGGGYGQFGNYVVNTAGGTTSTLTVNNAVDNHYGGFLGEASGGTMALVKDGVGKLTFNPNNTYSNWSGGTTIKNGTFAGGAYGSGGGLTFNVGTGNTGIAQIPIDVTLTSLNTDPANLGTAIVENGSASNRTLTINNAAANSYDGLVRDGTGGGNLALRKDGLGVLTLSGTLEQTGGTWIRNGILRTGANDVINGTNVAIGTNGKDATLDFDGNDDTIGNITYPVSNSPAGMLQMITLGGGTLTLGSNINSTETWAVGQKGISGPGTVYLPETRSINVTTQYGQQSGGDSFEISADITGAAGAGLTLSSSFLVLSGDNTYDGPTTLTGNMTGLGSDPVGTVGSIDSSPIGTGTLVFANGGIASDSSTAREILNAVSFTSNATIGHVTRDGYLTFSAGMDLGGSGRTITVDSDAQFDGIVTNGGISKTGAGTLLLTNPANDYASGTGVSGGILRSGNDDVLPDTGALAIGRTGTMDLAGFDDTVASIYLGLNDVGQLASITTGAGTLTLAGNINTDSNAFGNQLISGNLNLGAATRTISLGVSSNREKTLTISADISGDPGVGISYNGTNTTLVLSGTNTYDGDTTINSGTALFTQAASIGGTGRTVIIGSTGTAAAGYAMDNAFLNRIVEASTGSVALGADSSNDLDLNTAAGATLTAASLGSAGGNYTYSGTLTPNGATYRLGGGGGTLTMASVLTGANDLEIKGNVNLAGANTHTGTTTLTSGVANLAIAEGTGTGPLGNPATPAGSVIFGGGTLQYSDANQADYSGRLTTTGDNAYNIDTNGQTVTFATGLAASGASGLTKSGLGTLTLAGANTYTGTTTINAGMLELTGDNSGATGATTINSGTTLRATAANSLPTGTMDLRGTLDLRSDASTTYTAPSVINLGGSSTINVGPAVGSSVTGGTQTLTKVRNGASRTLTVTGVNGYSLTIGTYERSDGNDNYIKALTDLNINQLNYGKTKLYVAPGVNLTVGDAVLNEFLDKYDDGTMTVTGDITSSGNGKLSVQSGLLIFNGTMAINSTQPTQRLTVNNATIAGTGTINTPLYVDGSGSINLMDGVVKTNLVLGNTLTFNNSTTKKLYFDLGAGAAGTDKITVDGNTTVSDAGAPVINLVQLGGIATPSTPGIYTLIDTTGAGTMATADKFSLATTKAFGQTFSLGVVAEDLQVTTAAGTAGPATPTWTGTGAPNNLWTTTGNWDGAAIPGFSSDVLIDNNTVTTTNLDDDFDIDSLTVGANATSSRTIAQGTTPTGSTGMLTIEATSGTGITVATPASGAPTHTISADIGLAKDQTWTVNTNAQLTVSGTISDFGVARSLTKDGDGTLTFNSASNVAYLGGTVVNGGTLINGTAGAVSGALTVNAGGVVETATSYQSSNTSTLPQTININGGEFRNTRSSNGNTDFYVKSIDMTGGSLTATGATPNFYSFFNTYGNDLPINTHASSTVATISAAIASRNITGITFTTEQGTVPGGVDLLVSGPLFGESRNGNINWGITKAGPGVMAITSNNDVYGGVVSYVFNTGGGDQDGYGYTGGTTVNAGTLLVNNTAGSGTGSGAVTVASGATLGGSGAIGGTVNVLTGGTLAPGASVGTLTVNNDLTFADGGNNWVAELFGAGDRVDVAGTLTLGDNTALEFPFDAANPFQAGSYTLASYDTLAGTFSSVTSLGLYSIGVDYGTGTSDAITIEVLAGLVLGDANLDRNTDALDYVVVSNHYNIGSTWADGDVNGDGAVDALDYVVISNNYGSHTPEPATLAILAMGGAWLAFRRRRHGKKGAGMRNALKKIAGGLGAAVLALVVAAGACQASVIANLSLSVDQGTQTWKVYLTLTDTSNETLGLNGVYIDVWGSETEYGPWEGALDVNSATSKLPSGYALIGGQGTAQGFGSNAAGTAVDTGYEKFGSMQANMHTADATYDNILVGVGKVAGSVPSMIPAAIEWAHPVLVAEGTYTGTTEGWINVSLKKDAGTGEVTSATVLPDELPASGETFNTFSPMAGDDYRASFYVPEPATLALLGLGGLGLILGRKRR